MADGEARLDVRVAWCAINRPFTPSAPASMAAQAAGRICLRANARGSGASGAKIFMYSMMECGGERPKQRPAACRSIALATSAKHVAG